jgi:hypothetical protein
MQNFPPPAASSPSRSALDAGIEAAVVNLLTREVEAATVCALPYCNAVINSAVNEVVAHYWTHHRTLLAAVAFGGLAVLAGSSTDAPDRKQIRARARRLA